MTPSLPTPRLGAGDLAWRGDYDQRAAVRSTPPLYMGESVSVPRNESPADHVPQTASHADAHLGAAAGKLLVGDQPNVWLNEGPEMATPRRRGSVMREAIGRRPGVFWWRPTSILTGLGIAAVVTAGGVLVLSFVAPHASGGSATVPVVTAIMQAPGSVVPVAPAPTTSPASPAPRTLLKPTPPPVAVSAPDALNQAGTVDAGQQAATQAVASQGSTGRAAMTPAPDIVARHPASPPVRDQAPARELRPVAPPASPAAPLPPPSSSEDQQSPWNWNNSKKTTTCDASGRCVDHDNPEPNSSPGPSGTAPGTDPDQQPRAVCTYWDAEHNTSRKAPC